MFKMMEICNCMTELEEGATIMFRYYLLEGTKKININEENINLPSYGIQISSEKTVSGKLVDIYSDLIETVSPNKEKVVNLIEFMGENSVSPIHLIDIAGGYADEWIEDFENEAKSILHSISIA